LLLLLLLLLLMLMMMAMSARWYICGMSLYNVMHHSLIRGLGFRV